MRKKIERAIFEFQKGVLFISYYFCKILPKKRYSWVVGVIEIANNINFLQKIYPDSFSVNFYQSKFYPSNSYNFSLKKSALSIVYMLFMGPVLLGYLANSSNKFFYFWSKGFLLSSVDGRYYEFNFLQKRGKKIVSMFCGAEIRSAVLCSKLAAEMGIDNVSTYDVLLNPGCISDENEQFIKKLCLSADRFCCVIFNLPVDQLSYFKKRTKPFFYAYPDSKFVKNETKFLNLRKLKIVHAPSSPFVKGTPLVRAAIQKLRVQGYEFEYIECIHKSNEEVLALLRDAHIVVNQLYGFMPGLFGIEAMASYCAVLTSADATIEYSLPENANKAWFVTKYWEIYDHLKLLLDNPDLIRPYADYGYKWTYKNFSQTTVSKYLKDVLP